MEARRRPLWVVLVIYIFPLSMKFMRSRVVGRNSPVLESSFALFRFSKMSLMDLMLPFLQFC
jgi:hypothetical protein